MFLCMRYEPNPTSSKITYHQLIRWLQTLPDNMILGWADRHAENNMDRVCGWADIIVVPCSPGQGWAWTIARPGDHSNNDTAITIHAPCDLPGADDIPSGWSYEHISELLGNWVAENADRPDIRFEHDGELHASIRHYIETELFS